MVLCRPVTIASTTQISSLARSQTSSSEEEINVRAMSGLTQFGNRCRHLIRMYRYATYVVQQPMARHPPMSSGFHTRRAPQSVASDLDADFSNDMIASAMASIVASSSSICSPICSSNISLSSEAVSHGLPVGSGTSGIKCLPATPREIVEDIIDPVRRWTKLKRSNVRNDTVPKIAYSPNQSRSSAGATTAGTIESEARILRTMWSTASLSRSA